MIKNSHISILVIVIFVVGVFAMIGSGGGGSGTGTTGGGGSGTVAYFWCTAVKDAYVASYYPDWNRAGAFSNICSHGDPNREQRSYIQFYLPDLPVGTEVLEAYINVWEDSDTGQPGSSGIQIGTAVAEWDVNTITWNDQPNPVGPLSVGISIGTFISSNMWRTTGDVRNIVQGHLDDPSTNFGWILDNGANSPFTRSFMALNAPQARTADTLQTGPRLLMKVQSPVPMNSGNIGTNLPSDTELPGMYPGQAFTVEIFEFTNEWPAAWEVGTH